MRETLPVFPLDTVLYPGGPLPLRIFEARYVDMISRCLKDREGFVVSAIRRNAAPGTQAFHDIGTWGRIVDFEQLPGGLLGITIVGEKRMRLFDARVQADGLNVADAECMDGDAPTLVPDRCQDLCTLLARFLDELPHLYGRFPHRMDDAEWVGYRLTEILPVGLTQKQFFLELEDPIRRLDILRPLLDSLEILDSGGFAR